MRASLRSGPPGVFTMADPGVHDDRNPQSFDTESLRKRGEVTNDPALRVVPALFVGQGDIEGIRPGSVHRCTRACYVAEGQSGLSKPDGGKFDPLIDALAIIARHSFLTSEERLIKSAEAHQRACEESMGRWCMRVRESIQPAD